MEDITLQMKTLIHHILFRHKIYRLQMHQIQEMLYLLQQKPSQEPQQIQQLIFRGVRQFNQIYGDNIASALSQEMLSDVSIQTKALAHKVLHQFHFLNSIRAYEMFQPHFQQPALHSVGERGEKTNQLLNDQFERMRLHYMYYGPLSVYNFNQVSQPFFDGVQTNNFIPPSLPNQNLLAAQNIINQPPRPRGRPPLNTSKQFPNQDAISSRINQVKPKYLGRGRPPKSKKVVEEKLNLQSLQQQQQELRANVIQYEKQEQNKLLQLKECICQGRKRSGKVKTCSCGRRFHLICSQNEHLCFNCKQLELDPFTKVLSVIGEFIAVFDQTTRYEGLINLQPFSSIFQEQKPYEIMVSSANPNFSDACWPDDAIFSINDQPIFQIPALLKCHNQGRRADSFLNITPYLRYFYQTGQGLHQIRFKIEVKHFTQSQQIKRRNNRRGEFLISFFLVNQLNVDDLIRQVQEKYKNTKNTNSLITPFDSVAQNGFQFDKTNLSLLDPYSREMMKCPVRGRKCQHLQCFDLKNFLVVTHALQHRKWKCPHCAKDVRDLVISSYQLNLINQMQRSQKYLSQVVVYANGRVQYGDSQSHGVQNSGKSNEQ